MEAIRTMEQAVKTSTSTVSLSGNVGLSLEDFDGLVTGMQMRVYRLLLGMLRDQDAAETLTQDCFLKAYQGRRSYRGEASLSTWISQIAINLARDHQRNRKSDFWRKLFKGNEHFEAAAAAMPDRQPSHERALVAQEQVAAVWEAAEELSPQQRAVFVLRFVEDKTMEEIAEATGLKVGTVKIHLFRAVRAVRARVSERSGAFGSGSKA
ncbi:MAG TPA: sigma-70 family RNA polymerase sigma factor [Terriglobales bacterium]|nr:sigma-70 family RNA polymerase sigma factor [Terriglobales bacterium]